MKNYFITLCLLFMLPLLVEAQNLKELKGLDQFVDTTMQRWEVPGLAIAIVKDGKVIYEKGFGVKDLQSKEKVTPNTLFSIASSSKAFTATLAAMLVDEKKIDFDTPLINYFPDFQMYDKNSTEKITLRDLLTHRCGVPRQKFFSLNTPATRAEVRNCFRYFEPTYDLRYMYQYCNETFTIAGDMIAEKAGTTWENLIKTRIFGPLEMNNTLLSVSDVLKSSDYALPYIDGGGKIEKMEYHNADILGAAGCIISNVDDMSKWLLFNLNKGKVQDKQLMNPKRLQQIQSPQMVIPSGMKNKEVFFETYGMGWFVDNYRGYLNIRHGGVLYGFSSQVSFLPNENIGVVVLSNLNATPLVDIIERWVFDHLLKLNPVDWNGRALQEEAQFMAQYKNAGDQKDPFYLPDTKLSHPINDYTGIFKSEGYGSMQIVSEGDSLSTTLLGVKCPLNHYNYDVFDLYHPVEHMSWKMTFNSDIKGKISSFSVKLGNGLKEIKYIRQE